MRDLCLFDLDGTLTDPKEGITKSVQHALNYFSIKVSVLDELTKFIGPPLRDSFREFYGFSENDAELAVSKYREYFSETGIFENTLYKGTLELLDKLKSHDITMAIATSKPTVFAEQIAEHFKFKKYFDIIAGSELDGNRSRKSEVIGYVLNSIDAKRNKPTVMIGDRKHDIIGTHEMGIDSIGVTWGYGSRNELEEAKATYIVDSLEELYTGLTCKTPTSCCQ